MPAMRFHATADDLKGFDPETELGYPGEFPFTRGIQPTMYRGRLWTMRQYAGFGTATESNQRYRYLLSQGVNGLSVAFDLPTQIGYDSDHPLAAGEVGRVGVAIDSLEDMATLFDGIPLDQVSTSMTINATSIILLALYVAVGKRQGVAPKQLSGTIQNDILKEYIARGTYIYPPHQSLRIVTDIFSYCEQNTPQWNTISISGYHIREAGSTAVQEVAFTFANAIAYVQAALDAGLDINSVGQRLSFFFNAHNDFLEEVAKFRAARRLWARIMKDRFGATNPRAQQLRFHTQTAGSTLTAQQPDNNIVRVAVQALSAVLGGTQSLHTNALDEAIALPTEFSARIARNTQLILQEESHVTHAADPLAGSHYVEWLTDQLAQKAWTLIQEVEALGGMTKAIEAGLPKLRIEEAAARRQAAIDSGQETIVGVNKYQPATQEPLDILSIDNTAVRQAQIARLQELKRSRDGAKVQQALAAITAGARGSANLLELAVHAVQLGATVGEVSMAMEVVFGRHTANPRTVAGVYAAAGKSMHDLKTAQTRTAEFLQQHGRRPRILIAKMGQDGHDRGARVIASAFADMGFDVDIGPLFQTPDEVVKQAVENDVHLVGISSLAGGHKTLLPELVRLLRAAGRPDVRVVAGGVIPPPDWPALRDAGVVEIFGPGTVIPQAALRLLDLLGAKP